MKEVWKKWNVASHPQCYTWPRASSCICYHWSQHGWTSNKDLSLMGVCLRRGWATATVLKVSVSYSFDSFEGKRRGEKSGPGSSPPPSKLCFFRLSFQPSSSLQQWVPHIIPQLLTHPNTLYELSPAFGHLMQSKCPVCLLLSVHLPASSLPPPPPLLVTGAILQEVSTYPTGDQSSNLGSHLSMKNFDVCFDWVFHELEIFPVTEKLQYP